jgi:DNA-binding beta-propeller fold protein YncE
MLGKALIAAAAGNVSGEIVWPDVSTASFVRFDTVNIGANPYGIFFKPDGTKVYTLDADDTIRETNLSTAWDISTHGSTVSSFTTNQSYNIAPRNLFFKTDGTEMYVGDALSDRVVQYSLSTAWDLSTASYTQFFSVQSQQNTFKAMCFDDSGENMYICGTYGGDNLDRYTLSTAWDISTCSYHSTSGTVSSAIEPSGLFIKGDDGTKIFTINRKNDSVVQWDLSTAYSITSDVGQTADSSFSVATQETSPIALYISPDGEHMYVVGTIDDGIDQYSLG